MSRRKRVPKEPVEAVIDSLSHDGRGVAHIDGKAVFIAMALPGEQVRFQYTANRRRYDEGKVLEVLQASPDRVEPACAWYERCGGCSLQHLSSSAQLEAKQQIFLDALRRIAKVSPGRLLEPLQADIWGYRSKARLGVRYVPGKESVLVGFREKQASFITDMHGCEVLSPAVGKKIQALRELLDTLSIKAHIPQIEVAVGEQRTCLIFRILQPLSDSDVGKLRGFGELYDFEILTQSAGPDSVTSVNPESGLLQYKIDDDQLELIFSPQDFIQVNQSLNRMMITAALELLAPAKHETILDLFCGLGNFSLPLARRCKQLVGVEGDTGMVKRAYANAKHNKLSNLEFFAFDLFSDATSEHWMQIQYQKVLLDPPRAGAEALMQPIASRLKPEKILYISCNPATLARDTGILVRQCGYQLNQAGIMDMFPHTSHIECIALFEPR